MPTGRAARTKKPFQSLLLRQVVCRLCADLPHRDARRADGCARCPGPRRPISTSPSTRCIVSFPATFPWQHSQSYRLRIRRDPEEVTSSVWLLSHFEFLKTLVRCENKYSKTRSCSTQRIISALFFPTDATAHPCCPGLRPRAGAGPRPGGAPLLLGAAGAARALPAAPRRHSAHPPHYRLPEQLPRPLPSLLH